MQLTKETVQDTINTTQDKILKTLLLVITTPKIPIKNSLIYRDGKVHDGDTSYDLALPRSAAAGYVFMRGRYAPYTSTPYMRKKLNEKLQSAFATPDATIAKIRTLFKE